MHAQMLRHRGAYTVMIGLLDHRLAVAERLGINLVINAKKQDPLAAVKEVSDGRGADVVVNAAGSVAVLKQSIDLAARRGHVLYFAATLAPEVTLDLDLMHYKELRAGGQLRLHDRAVRRRAGPDPRARGSGEAVDLRTVSGWSRCRMVLKSRAAKRA